MLAYMLFAHWPEKRKENLRGPSQNAQVPWWNEVRRTTPTWAVIFTGGDLEIATQPTDTFLETFLVHWRKCFYNVQCFGSPLLFSCFINDQGLDLVKVRLLESSSWQQWIRKEFWETRKVVYFLRSCLSWFVCNLFSCANFTIWSGSFLCYHLGHRSLDIFCWIFFVVCLTSLRFLAVESELFESHNSRL